MDERVAVIAQKRATLRGQIESITDLIARDEFDIVEARLRLERVKTLFHNYEELHDELALLELDEEGQLEMINLNDSFYRVAAKIETEKPSDRSTMIPSSSTIPLGHSTFIERQRQLKLPVAELPKFSGDVEQWLTFKNTFKAMIESRTDITDLVKFMYLKNCLKGEAANKIALFDTSDANYTTAWALLTEAYERKRVLISKHLDAILGVPRMKVATAKGLSELIDSTRQHMSLLQVLEFQINDYVVVHVLEQALPGDIRLKWEESLSLDQIPTLQVFYKFIGGVIFRLLTVEGTAASPTPTTSRKRFGERNQTAQKAKKLESGTRAFVTNTSACVQCNGGHAIYSCPNFRIMSINQRWDSVKQKGLCCNCLREHEGGCTTSRCKHCQRFHHTLLHAPRSSTSTSFQPKVKKEFNPNGKAV